MQKKFPLKHLLLLCFLCLSARAFAQQVKVEGTVTSADSKEALPGVTIHVKGGKSGTTTDASGHYAVDAAPNAVLVFTFIGYNSRELKINGKTLINAQLTPSSQSLKETVIIGYQQQTIRNSTAAITTVSGKDIENLPAPSFANLIQGRVPGVNIQNYTGEPGVRNTFVVRGNSRFDQNLDEAHALSSPLFIIDGVPTNLDDISTLDNTNTSFLAGINPNDIESIQVLKDAAATAVWGSRGANGVVIIQTKRGKIGKPQFDLNFYTGVTEKP
ncbi:MAG TPA: TonB-dependent receptor plug domain-containing protein, partial [Chitinophagaceae bacterium]